MFVGTQTFSEAVPRSLFSAEFDPETDAMRRSTGMTQEALRQPVRLTGARADVCDLMENIAVPGMALEVMSRSPVDVGVLA